VLCCPFRIQETQQEWLLSITAAVLPIPHSHWPKLCWNEATEPPSLTGTLIMRAEYVSPRQRHYVPVPWSKYLLKVPWPPCTVQSVPLSAISSRFLAPFSSFRTSSLFLSLTQKLFIRTSVWHDPLTCLLHSFLAHTTCIVTIWLLESSVCPAFLCAAFLLANFFPWSCSIRVGLFGFLSRYALWRRLCTRTERRAREVAIELQTWPPMRYYQMLHGRHRTVDCLYLTPCSTTYHLPIYSVHRRDNSMCRYCLLLMDDVKRVEDVIATESNDLFSGYKPITPYSYSRRAYSSTTLPRC